MNLQNSLAATLVIDHLSGSGILGKEGNVAHRIPNVPGKQSPLKLYRASVQESNGKLDAVAAERGLVRFTEHATDVEANPGRHPNIDLLFKMKVKSAGLISKPLTA